MNTSLHDAKAGKSSVGRSKSKRSISNGSTEVSSNGETTAITPGADKPSNKKSVSNNSSESRRTRSSTKTSQPIQNGEPTNGQKKGPGANKKRSEVKRVVGKKNSKTESKASVQSSDERDQRTTSKVDAAQPKATRARSSKKGDKQTVFFHDGNDTHVLSEAKASKTTKSRRTKGLPNVKNTTSTPKKEKMNLFYFDGKEVKVLSENKPTVGKQLPVKKNQSDQKVKSEPKNSKRTGSPSDTNSNGDRKSTVQTNKKQSATQTNRKAKNKVMSLPETVNAHSTFAHNYVHNFRKSLFASKDAIVFSRPARMGTSISKREIEQLKKATAGKKDAVELKNGTVVRRPPRSIKPTQLKAFAKISEVSKRAKKAMVVDNSQKKTLRAKPSMPSKGQKRNLKQSLT